MLDNLSRTRAQKGLLAQRNAMFVFSSRSRCSPRLAPRLKNDPERLASEDLDDHDPPRQAGPADHEAFQRSREEIILRQQKEPLELSTPVVKLWDGILALPLVGTLDSARTQV
jgi:rsbT co-antagonist protein RsbR